MIMLVNQGSASATEILAGALKDHSRAVLVGPEGTNTYGKAMVQSITPLRVSLEKDEDGNYLPNAIRLTTARYYTPNNVGENGKSIHGIGIEPDVTVAISPEQMVDLQSKGWLLGEPPLTKTEEAEIKKEQEEVKEPERKEDLPTIEESGEQVEEEQPFYLRKPEKEEKPVTPDLQLRYGVDLLRTLLIVENGRSV